MKLEDVNQPLPCIMLHCSEISPDNTNAQSRLPSCDTSSYSLADKCLEHSCINSTFPLLHLNWFILLLLHAWDTSISQALIFINCRYQKYYKSCKKPRDEKQADVSEKSGPSGYTPISLPLILRFLLTATSHMQVTDFYILGVLPCSVTRFDHGEVSGEK